MHAYVWLNCWFVVQLLTDDCPSRKDNSPSLWLKFKNYSLDMWNFLDMLTLVTYVPGLILRFIPLTVCGACFYASRIVFAFNYMMFFFRVLHMFAIHQELGPKLVMIGRMVRFFLVLSTFNTIVRSY